MGGIELIRQSLRTIGASSSFAMREAVVRALRASVGSDAAIFYNVHPGVQGLSFGAIHTDASPTELDPVRPQLEKPLLFSPTLRVKSPAPADTRSFSTGTDRWVAARGRDQMVGAIYGPLGVYDDLRLLAYDGPRFVGWIGAVRRGRGSYFRDSDVARIQPLVGEIVRLLALAATLDGPDEEGNLHLVLTPQGEVRHATTEAEQWLTGDRANALRDWIRELNGSEVSFTRTFGSTRARAARLEGLGGTVYLVTLSAIGSLLREGLESLTAVQREIALLAATGATAEELGIATGRSPETVRVHLKAIYKRLHISTRAELVNEVQSWRRRVGDAPTGG